MRCSKESRRVLNTFNKVFLLFYFMEGMEISYFGSKCGRYVYGLVMQNGIEIDRYIVKTS